MGTTIKFLGRFKLETMNSVWLLLFISLANYCCYGHEEEDQICFKVPPVGGNCGCLLNNNEVCLNLPHTSARGQCDPGQCDLFKTTVDLTQIGLGGKPQVQVPNPMQEQKLNKQAQEIAQLKSQLNAVTKQLSNLAANQAPALPKADPALVKNCSSYNGKIYNGTCYFIIEQPLTKQADALKKCQAVNANATLADIAKSSQYIKAVVDILRPSSYPPMENFYIGGTYNPATRSITNSNGGVVSDGEFVWGKAYPNIIPGTTQLVLRIYAFYQTGPEHINNHIAVSFYDLFNMKPSTYAVRVICQV